MFVNFAKMSELLKGRLLRLIAAMLACVTRVIRFVFILTAQTDTECTGSFILSVLTNSRNIFQIVNIGNKSAAMAEADPGAAPPTEGGGAESGDGTIVRGQQFLVGPR